MFLNEESKAAKEWDEWDTVRRKERRWRWVKQYRQILKDNMSVRQKGRKKSQYEKSEVKQGQQVW